jgi:hypothetical protein
VQPQKGVGKRAAVRTGIDHMTVVVPRQVPEIAESAPIFLVDERPEFLGQASHGLYIARHAITMKCLAT